MRRHADPSGPPYLLTKSARRVVFSQRRERELDEEIRGALVTLDQSPGRSPQSNNHPQTMSPQVADASDLEPIRTLLADLDLPHEDLTADHMTDFLVSREADLVIGVVGIEQYEDMALLRSLAVRPDHRDRGLGTRLTQDIEAHARNQGVRELYLLTTTAADFFRRRDYSAIERDALPASIEETEEAMTLCPDSATTMMKRIR